MKQEIDFLKSIPKEPLPLPAAWITLAVVATAGLFMLISLGMGLTQIKDAWNLRQIQHAHMDTVAVFQKTAKTYPLLASETPLIEQVASLQEALNKKKIYYADLSRSVLRYGFSNHLGALAQIVPKGLWLNEIKIDQVTKNISLSGYMLQPVDVSLFLEALQHATPFSEATFDVFYIKAVPEQSVIEFSITNTEAAL